jgi:hypothetical protein
MTIAATIFRPASDESDTRGGALDTRLAVELGDKPARCSRAASPWRPETGKVALSCSR